MIAVVAVLFSLLFAILNPAFGVHLPFFFLPPLTLLYAITHGLYSTTWTGNWVLSLFLTDYPYLVLFWPPAHSVRRKRNAQGCILRD